MRANVICANCGAMYEVVYKNAIYEVRPMRYCEKCGHKFNACALVVVVLLIEKFCILSCVIGFEDRLLELGYMVIADGDI